MILDRVALLSVPFEEQKFYQLKQGRVKFPHRGEKNLRTQNEAVSTPQLHIVFFPKEPEVAGMGHPLGHRKCFRNG